MSKKCTKCGELKPLNRFSKCAQSKNGILPQCKDCRSVYWKLRMEKKGTEIRSARKQYREQNKDRLSNQKKKCYLAKRQEYIAKSSAYKQNNPSKYLELGKKYREKNRQRIRDKNKKWFKDNPWKRAFYSKLRRTIVALSTPKWLTLQHLEEIEELYRLATELAWLNEGVKFHVDHIIPLKSKNVCGLHVPWSLQLLQPYDNLRKSNLLTLAPIPSDKGYEIK